VRRTVQMEDGAAVILSVAKYYAPTGKAIQETGVVPTVQVAEADNSPEYDENGNPVPGSEPKNTQDNLLKNAVELVTGKSTVAQLNNPASVPVAVDSSVDSSDPMILQKNKVPQN
jgi:carboxyl-terminal processing protease